MRKQICIVLQKILFSKGKQICLRTLYYIMVLFISVCTFFKHPTKLLIFLKITIFSLPSLPPRKAALEDKYEKRPKVLHLSGYFPSTVIVTYNLLNISFSHDTIYSWWERVSESQFYDLNTVNADNMIWTIFNLDFWYGQ